MNKNVHLCQDIPYIKALLHKVYDEVAYDNSPSLDDFEPQGVWFILTDGNQIAGLINLMPLNNMTWMPHIIIHEEYRGKNSYEWGNQVVEIMKKLYKAEKFLAFTPYKTAKKYAEKMGFKQIAVLPNSIKKNGAVLDQYILEL